MAQALVSTGTVLLAALMARHWFGARAGLIAAGLCAVYPYYVMHDVVQQETVLFTFLAALATWLVLTARERDSIGLAGLAGIALGAAILTRATLAPFALFATAWLMLPRTGRAATMGLACLAATLLVLSPWLVRANVLTGRWTLGTEFGAAVFAGNHPLTFSHYPRESIDRSRAAAFASISAADKAELALLDEPSESDWYLARGIEWVERNPGAALQGGLRKLAAAFGPLPVPRHGWLGDTVHALSFFPVLVLALAMLWRRSRLWREDALVYGHVALFAAITAVPWAQTSHRSYLDVYLMVFAAGALDRWWRPAFARTR